MKREIKKFAMLLPILLLMVILTSGNAIRVDAKVQDGKYYFSSCATKKFQIKDNKLTLKVNKSKGNEITIGDKKLYKLNVKVSKNCKYGYEGYSRRDMGSNPEKRGSTYSEVKELIKFDSDWYKESGYANNFTNSYIKIKNGKVVKIVYCVLV